MTLKEYMKKNHPCAWQYGMCPKAYHDTREFCNECCSKFKGCDDCLNQEYIPKEGEEVGTKEYIVKLPDDAVCLNVITVSENVNCCQSINVKDLQEYRRLKDSLAIDARKSGYNAGYEDGRKDECFNACEKLENTVWGLARKISHMSADEKEECFGLYNYFDVLLNLSYGEAKEKYDIYMENKIEVGDEISDGEETGYVLWIEGKECMAKLGSYDCPQSINLNKRNFRKTGRNNPKLAEVMREISET